MVIDASQNPHNEGVRSSNIILAFQYLQLVFLKNQYHDENTDTQLTIKELCILRESLNSINIYQLVPKIHSP